MTMSGDFIPNDDGDSGISTYPTVLGVTLTPVVLAIVFVVLGLGIAIPLYFYLLQPKQQEVDALKAEIEQKQAIAVQAKASVKKLVEVKKKLEIAQQQKLDVLSLFSDQRSLDVMLLDVNREFLKLQPKATPKVTRPSGVPANTKVPEGLKPPIPVLNSFAPSAQVEVVADGSLGPEANGKLQRQSFAINMNGDFNQTQTLLRNLESMQPLTKVANFTMATQGSQPVVVTNTGTVTPFTSPSLAVSFSLQTIVPVQPSPSPAPPPKPK